MNSRQILLFFILLGVRQIWAQTNATDQVWVNYMLEPNPNYYKVKKAFYDYWGDSVPKRSNGYKIFKRWEWRVTQNMLVDGTVVWPTQQLTDFLNSYSTPQKGNNIQGLGGGGNGVAPCPEGGRWNPVGPVRHPYNQTSQPTGIGRISGIAFHPTDSNTLFACTPQGGLWKTVNNGSNWKQVFGKGPIVSTIGTNSLVLSSNNPDTMYLGTGDRDAGDAPGYGVLASWDGGNTWVLRNSGMGNRRVGRMVMHPTNSSILIASTDAGIYRSTNKGLSWTLTLSGGSWDVAFKPTDANVVYAVLGASFYRSTDNGQTWTLVTSGLPTSGIQRGMLAITKADENYVYFLISNSGSGYFGIYRSTNSGVDFTAMSTTPNILGYSETGSGSGGQAWYDLDLAADPISKNTIYAFGINIWKSTNGGANWTINGHWVGYGGADDVHADQHTGEFSNSGRKLYAGNDGGVYYTTNGGSTWINISTGIQNSQIYRLSQAQTDPYAGAQGYQDNGSSQTQQDEFYTYYGGDGMDCQTDPLDHNYMYGSYVYGVIYRSIDKTTNRTIAQNGTNGINEGGGWLTPFILQEGNPARMFAGYVNVWRCDNVKASGAIAWTRITSGFSGNVRCLENSPASNSVLYVINGSGLLYLSTNASAGSPTWSNISANQPSGLRYIEAHHKYPNTLFACNGTNLYRSTNQGSTWTSIAVLPSSSGSMNCLFIDSSNTTERLYIGSEKGVYVWDSATSTVYTFNTGFPVWADVTDLDIYYSPKGKQHSKIVASTYGMGVWRSNLFEDGTLSPIASFYAFDSVFVSSGTLRLYEDVQHGASSLRWKIAPYSYSYIEGTDSLSRNPVIRISAKGLYSVSLIASNCQGSDTFSKKSWIRVYNAANAAACKNTTNYQTSNYAIGVFRIKLTDNFSESGTYFDEGEYYDRSSDKIFRLLPSTTYTATIKTGIYNPEYVRMYFDYDNNGRFEFYKGEVSTLPSTVLGSRTISFTTPTNLKPNKGIRMRVLSDFYTIDTNACRNLGYGQGEDYTLIYDKPIPEFKTSKLAACLNENIIFTDSTDGLADAWVWNFGVGASPAAASGPGPHSVSYSSIGNKTISLKINGKDSIRKIDLIRIDASPQPIASIKLGNISGCEGRNVSFVVRSTNGVPFTVQWQKNGVDISGKTDSILSFSNLTIAENASYRARLKNGGCVVFSNAIGLVVYPKPLADFSINNAAQCYNYHLFGFTNNSSITSGTLSQFLWSFGDGNTSNNTNETHKYNAPSNYNVKLFVSSNQGCMDSISKSVALYYNAKLKFTINDTDQCLTGNSFNFNNNSTIGNGSISYSWQFGDGNTSTAASPVKSYTNNGLYNVILTSNSNNSCKDTLKSSVRVYSQPQPQFGILNNAQCLKRNSFSFTNFTVNTDGSFVSLWNFDDGNNSSTTNPVHSYLQAGTKSVKLKITTSFGCVDSISKTVTVFPQATLKIAINDSAQCQSGNLFVFSNNSTVGNGNLNFSWTFGDNTTSNQREPQKNYIFPGIYKVVAISNSNNSCKDTFSSFLRVYSQPSVDFSANNAVQCLKGNSFNFLNASFVSDTTFNNYWDFKNGSSSVLLNPQFKFLKHGDYDVKLVVTSNFGCMDSLVKRMKVHPIANVGFSMNDSDQCLRNNSFKFTNVSTISTGNIDQIQWMFGDGSLSNHNTPVHIYGTHNTFIVKLVVTSNLICNDTLAKAIRVYAQPLALFSTSPALQSCLKYNVFENKSESIIAEGSLTPNWNFGDGVLSTETIGKHSYLAHGNYNIQLKVFSNFGCTDSTSKTITIYPSPIVAFNTSKSLICENEILDFSNFSAIYSGTIDYDWQFGQGLQSSLVQPITSYPKFGNFDVLLIGISNKGCADSTTKSIEVASLPLPVISTLVGEGCANQTKFEFISQSTNPDGRSLNYYWSFGDTTNTINNPVTHMYKKPGNYTVTLRTASSICTALVSKPIVVSPQVSALFLIKSISAETRRLIAQDTLIGGYDYLWNFGDGETGTGAKATHLYPDNRLYKPQLIVRNKVGCSDTSESEIIISSPNYKVQENALNFYVYPNPTHSSFTFKFEIKNAETVTVDLYNILGQSPLYSKTWNQVESGTYFESINLEQLGLSAGTYPFRIKSGEKQVVIKIIYTAGL